MNKKSVAATNNIKSKEYKVLTRDFKHNCLVLNYGNFRLHLQFLFLFLNFFEEKQKKKKDQLYD